MSEPSLLGVFSKLNRAWDRLYELDGLFDKFREPGDPYRYTRHEESNDVDTTTFRYFGHIDRAIPTYDWSVVIGEFLYDVRSALDHLACQLAIVHCSPCEPPIGIRFPIFSSERKFFEQMRGRCGGIRRWAHGSGVYQFRAMSAAAQARILELQPYHRRRQNPERDPLFVLHQLCNEDKHETFPLMASAVEAKVTPAAGNEAKIRVRYQRHGPFEDGAELLRIEGKYTRPNSRMAVQTEFWIREAFSPTGPASGNFIGPQLRDIYNDVIEEVIPKFREFF